MQREYLGFRNAVLLIALLAALGTTLLAIGGPAEATFPGQNGALAFERFGDVYLDYPDETGAQKISGDGIQANPAISPDGTKLAFNSSRPNGDPVAVYLVGASGGEVSRLASSSGFDNDPDWGPADVSAPTVENVSPARNVAPRAKVTATFSEPMRASTLNDATFVLRKKGATNGVAATVGYDAAAKKAWLDPSRNLRAGTTYVVTLEGGDTGAKDLSGNPLASRKTWSFTVKR